ncbi:DUF2513 domain-containing protein [Virgibacillus alimentarius]|uniref:DUF2513 domain-containing protein n=1 Tax=Virgibacillus alimentarius TaxID=698769 RepID=UPI0004934F2B|nr:DUF2513 domain-containing protein [Virgibacillus alimentarius]
MKRDMELVRKMLFDFSEGKGDVKASLHDERDKEYIYHLRIMRQAGLIEYKESKYKGGMLLYRSPTLTWQGNDYLDAISNESVWNKTKEGVKAKGLELGNVPFSVVKECAIMQLKQLIGLQ